MKISVRGTAATIAESVGQTKMKCNTDMLILLT